MSGIRRVPDSGRPGGFFPVTRWTVVRELSSGECRVRFAAWEDFVIAYQRPLLLWLGGQCGNPGLAEELVQSFFVKIHSKEQALQSLDSSKGRLRSWLLVSLRRHWLDHCRREARRGAEPFDEVNYCSGEDAREYDREWAMNIARRVLSEIRNEHFERGSMLLFNAMLETIDGGGSKVRNEWCNKLGMTPNTFAVALMRFRRKLLFRLRQEVAATIVGGDDAEVDAELRHLISILSRSGGVGTTVQRG